jgi:fucose permease
MQRGGALSKRATHVLLDARLPTPALPRSAAPQAENCFATWLYTYAVQGAGLGLNTAATVVSLFWGAFTAGRLLAIPASARFAPGAILLASLPLAIVGPVVALLGRGSAGALYVAAVTAGLGISTGTRRACPLLVPCCCVLTRSFAPSRAQPGFANSVSLLSRYVAPTGKVQALIQLAATAGSMTFPPAVALIAQQGVVGVRAASNTCTLTPVRRSSCD